MEIASVALAIDTLYNHGHSPIKPINIAYVGKGADLRASHFLSIIKYLNKFEDFMLATIELKKN